MREVCHRCHLELPHPTIDGPRTASENILFCPHCSAPQIRLLEYLQPEALTIDETSGATPPPKPQRIDWRLAVRSASAVALVGVVLTLIGLKLPVVSLVGTFWIISCAILTLGIYARQRPLAPMDTGIGLRIGLAAGVLMVSALGISLAIVGLLVRFRFHGMGALDQQIGLQLSSFRAQIVTQLQTQQQSAEIQQKALGFLDSPEFRGGIAVVNLGMLGVFLLLFAAAGGAFAGKLRIVRKPAPQSE